MVVELLKIIGVAQGGTGGFVVAAVIEALVVFGPGCAGKFHPFEIVGEIFSGVDIADVPLGPVGAGGSDGVGHQFAVVGDGGIGEGDCAIWRESVGVEQDAGLGVEGFGDEEDVLLLKSGVVQEEVASAVLAGSGEALVVPELGEAVADGLAIGELVEIAEG